MKNHGRSGRDVVRLFHRHELLSRLSRIFAGLEQVRGGERRGRWTPVMGAMAMCLVMWSSAPTLGDRFVEALACLRSTVSRSRLGRSYNGLLGALTRQWPGVRGPLKRALRQQALEVMQHMHALTDWLVLAVDGSREELPRTRANRRRYGTSDNGAFPQAYITAIVHALTGLVWDWRIGPARSSERDHLASMVRHLPRRTLLLMDAYYVGYDLWTRMMDRGVHFLMRAGGNLRVLQDLFPGRHTVDRRAGIVHVWPKKCVGSKPPIRLRLIRIGSGSRSVYLLTTVLEPTRLSRKRAGEMYRLRWGVEMFYRSIKQTLEAAKMKSRVAARVGVELNWTIVAAAVLALLATTTLRARRLDPGRWSFALTWRVVRHAMHEKPRPRGHRRCKLEPALARAVKDRYRRNRPKCSRHNPKTVNTPDGTTKPPRVQKASPRLQRLAAATTPRQLLH